MGALAARPEQGRAAWQGSGVSTLDRHWFWRQTLRHWDVAFYGLTAVAAASVLLMTAQDTRRWFSLALLGLLVVAYLVLARPGALRGSGRRVDAYLAVLVVVTGALVATVSSGFVLLFVAYSQVWFFTRSRRAGIAWCVALTAGVVAGLAVSIGDLGEAWADVGTQMLASLVFSVALGLWITQQAEVSTERAELLERLEATRAELAASHHAAGVVAERERLAQEIHDTLAQGFTSIVMLTQTAAALLERGRLPEVPGRLDQIEQVARDNLAEARALVAAFGPVGLRDATLGQALQRLGRRFEEETGVRVVVHTDPEAVVDADAAVVLLRGAQEALANVRRHAAAGRVRVELVLGPAGSELVVQDDGCGLPDDVREGIGLTGMRDRVAAGGGTVEFGPAAERGTELRLRLPTSVAQRSSRTDERPPTAGGMR